MTECFQQISLGFHDLPQAAYDYAEAKGTLYSATELANSIRMPFELPRNRSLALCLKELLEAVEGESTEPPLKQSGNGCVEPAPASTEHRLDPLVVPACASSRPVKTLRLPSRSRCGIKRAHRNRTRNTSFSSNGSCQ